MYSDGESSDDDKDSNDDGRSFYDGRSIKETAKIYGDSDLLEMFLEINERNPNSWYKSYRVTDFISDLGRRGIYDEDGLRAHLIANKCDPTRNLNFAEEVLADILSYFNI